MKSLDVVVVGGGIAGLAVARHLVPEVRGVCVLEREPLLASHSSGRNAAIFRHLDLSAGVTALAVRSGVLLDELLGARSEWLDPSGALFVSAGRPALDALLAVAQAEGIDHRLVERDELSRRVPLLASGEVTDAVHVPGDGVMDVHAMTCALAEAARAGGARIRTGAEVVRIRAARGRVEAVELAGGEVLPCGKVVVAAGAWAQGLGESAGAGLPLAPMRRHLALLEPPCPLPSDMPVVWRVDSDEVYLRRETGGALGCPCDEDAFAPCLPPESPEALLLLAEKLARLAPAVADAGVRRSWAGLRTFAPDRNLVAGADPRVEGLFWLAGLGGHGMTAGTAAGELVARAIRGEPEAVPAALRPARLLARNERREAAGG